MRYTTLLEKATAMADRGDLDGAAALLRSFLGRKSEKRRLTTYARGSLYLGYILYQRGKYGEAAAILGQLHRSEATDTLYRAHALVELLRVHRRQRDYGGADERSRQFEALLDAHELAAPPPERKKLMLNFLNARALLRERQDRWAEAQEDLEEALQWLISLSKDRVSTRDFVIVYINFYNLHMVLGNVEKAAEYLTLAWAKMKVLDRPFAYGLNLWFENLAIHNLFAAGDQHQAIEALANISEQVVDSFAHLRKVFDFFAALIVQLHESECDVARIHEIISAYNDDPLIKAYVPTLLKNARKEE